MRSLLRRAVHTATAANGINVSFNRPLLRLDWPMYVESGGEATRLSVAVASDPAAWSRAFVSHWQQASSIMQSSQRATVTQEHIDAVFRHLDDMAFLLLCEVNAAPEPEIGPLLDKFFVEDIMSHVVRWALATPLRHTQLCQVRLLKLYESMLP